MTTERPIPVFFNTDVETDDRPASPLDRQPWDGFGMTWDILESYRPRLEEATGAPVRFIWNLRMDPQIEKVYGTPSYAVDANTKLIERILERGDQIGLHPHSFRWDDRLDGWVCDRGSEAWTDQVIETSFQAYASSLGRPCRVSRFGEFWMTDRAVRLVERLGGRFDMTIEPGLPPMPTMETDFPFTATLPGFEGVPQEPYHPAPEDFRRPDLGDGDGMWLIPMSTESSRPRAPVPRANPIRQPVRAARAIRRRVRHPVRTVKPPLRTLSPWMRWSSPSAFWRAAERLISRLERPYLAVAIKTDVPLFPIQLEGFTAIMEHLFDRPLVRRLRFTTPEDGLRLLGYEPTPLSIKGGTR